MTRRLHSFGNGVDSDVSSPSDDDDLFDIDEDLRDDSTEPTELDPDDLDLDDEDSDLGDEESDLGVEDFDIDGQVPLYGGNVHPPEYYWQGIQEPVQREKYARYAEKTRLRLIEVEDQWEQYVAHHRRSLHRPHIDNL